MSKPLVSLGLGACLLFSTLTARADVPPTCDVYDQDLTCDQADVGKTCASVGTCFELTCDGSSAGHVYKCKTCPTPIDDPTKICADFANTGKVCGDGGTCQRIGSYCPMGNTVLCAKPAAVIAQAPASPGDSDGGCAMSPSGRHNAAAALMALAGAAALLLDRRRR